MAFKLVGDQVDGIRKVQKKRVRELLLNNIPENEVFVMRNGRFACLICGHRPVFHSLEVLSIHRKGKKHLQAATKKIHFREISTSKAIMTHCNEAPMLAKTKQAKIDCLAAVDRPSSQDDSYTTATTKGLDETIIAMANLDRTATTDDDESSTERSRKPVYVFPWKHKVGEKRCNSKRELPEDSAGMSKKPIMLPLRSSGWIANGDGTWSKEDGVEFDSDEDNSVAVSQQ